MNDVIASRLSSGQLAPLLGLYVDDSAVLERRPGRQVWRTPAGPDAVVEFTEEAPPTPLFSEIQQSIKDMAWRSHQGVVELRPASVDGSARAFLCLLKKYIKGLDAGCHYQPHMHYLGTLFLPCSLGRFTLQYQACEGKISGAREATVISVLGLDGLVPGQWWVDAQEYEAVGPAAKSRSDDAAYDIVGHPLTVVRAQVTTWELSVGLVSGVR